jgi:hypothetical protein
MKRRDFLIRATLISVALGGLVKLDMKEVSDDEKDLAKQAMAIFCGSYTAGNHPEPDQVAEVGKAAIRGWRKLNQSE